MSIKLDWQIETEHVYERIGEDPKERRKRRLTRVRFLLVVGVVVGVILGIVGAVAARLSSVDNKIREDLLDVVQTETTTIRIGDRVGYLSLQRSASDFWIKAQSERFSRYQELKTSAKLEATGEVLDVAIDGQRARVLLQETMNGKPYVTAWFYWRYADGWRHVPSDYTFWGDEQTISGSLTKVTYREVDQKLAQALAARVEKWWSQGCQNLGCDLKIVKPLHIQIVPNPSQRLRWDDGTTSGAKGVDENTLVVPSPLSITERVSLGDAILPALEDEIAAMIAERQFNLATNNLVPMNVADAAWLRQAIIQWSVVTYTGRGDANQVSFVQSLYGNYGAQALSGLVHALTPVSSMRVIAQVLRLPVESLSLDWRTFFQWRLDVEKTLLLKNDQAAFAALWDTSNPQTSALMQQRMARPTQASGQVQAVAVAKGADGLPRASVQIVINTTPSVIFFRLVDGEWKRSA